MSDEDEKKGRDGNEAVFDAWHDEGHRLASSLLRVISTSTSAPTALLAAEIVAAVLRRECKDLGAAPSILKYIRRQAVECSKEAHDTSTGGGE